MAEKKPVQQAVPTEAETDAHVDDLVNKALKALEEFEDFTQEQVDYIVAKCSVAGLDHHGILAEAAVNETGRGVFEDKAVKNLFACEYVTNNLRHLKTVGIINEDPLTGITEIAEPVGVVCGIVPTTNPTSTVIFKSLIALKTRNPIIFSFHPSAHESSKQAAIVIRDAAIAAGGIYGWSGDVSDKLKIIGCENFGAVTATGKKTAGGIVGQCRVITVENCTNNGNISSSLNAGGIIGANDTAAATIIGCHNTGAITGAENKFGGIAGAVIGTIKNCTTTTGTDVLVGTFGTNGLANTNTIELSERTSIKVSAFKGNISLKNVTIDSLTDYIGTGVRQITLDNSTITTLTMTGTGSAAVANHRTVLTRSENDTSTIGSIVVNGQCKDEHSFIYIYLNGVCNSVTNNMTRNDDPQTGANVCTFATGNGIDGNEGGTDKTKIDYVNPSNAEGGAR